MSFWTLVGVKIESFECFKVACERNQISVNENPSMSHWNGEKIVAELRDQVGHSTAYVVQSKGALRLVLDTDAHYSSITKRLGPNGGKLGQDYSREVIRREHIRKGDTILVDREEQDGWRLVKVAAR